VGGAVLDDVDAARVPPCFGAGPAIGARRCQVSAVTRARTTALYQKSRAGVESWVTPSVQSAVKPFFAPIFTRAFCNDVGVGERRGLSPVPSAGPRFAWRGPAVRV
jgi:hypothetical protein